MSSPIYGSSPSRRPPKSPFRKTDSMTKIISQSPQILKAKLPRLPPTNKLVSPNMLIPKIKTLNYNSAAQNCNSNNSEYLLPSISKFKRERRTGPKSQCNGSENSNNSKNKFCPMNFKKQANSEVMSRRLVEYFIVVSSVPRKKAIPSAEKNGKPPSTPPRSESFHEIDEMEDDCDSKHTNPAQTSMSTSVSSLQSDSTLEHNSSRQQLTPKLKIPVILRRRGSETLSPVLSLASRPPIHKPINKLKNKIKTTFNPSPSDHSRFRKRRDYGNINMNCDYQTNHYDRIEFHPLITDRFPLEDYPDNPLNNMVTHFCFPSSKDLGLKLEYVLPKIHYFVLTNEKGQKIYGTCLTIYEPYDVSNEQNEDLQLQLEHLLEGQYNHQELRYKEVYLPKCLCILSSWPYLLSFRTYLTQLYRLATMSNLMKVPIERYISNLCLEIPCPPPGTYEIQTSIFSTNIRFWAPPANQPISYVALPYHQLFSCLDISNVIFVWKALALERKVLLVSSQISLLTICSELLLSFLFPFEWPYLYIPVLPLFLAPMLDAPVPFLCGLDRKLFGSFYNDLAEDVILVDLDKNEVTMGPDTSDLAELPYKRRLKLEQVLKSNAGDVFWKAHCVRKSNVDNIIQDSESNIQPEVRLQSEEAWSEKLETFDQAYHQAYQLDSLNLEGASNEQSNWDAIQEAFLRFYVALLKDYRKYLKAYDKKQRITGASLFQHESFVENQPIDFKPFLKEFCRAQQFDDFITKRTYDPNRPDILFFDQSIDAKSNRSKIKLKKVETPFLRSAQAHKQLHKILAIEPDDTGLDSNVFFYPTWPDKLDKNLFGEARPIPKNINAEFDRRQHLAEKLRSSTTDSMFLEENKFLDADPSPEVATYTLFFIIYATLTGTELRRIHDRSANVIHSEDNSELEETSTSSFESCNSHSAPQNKDREVPKSPVLIDLDEISHEDDSLSTRCSSASKFESNNNVIIGLSSNSVEVSFKSTKSSREDVSNTFEGTKKTNEKEKISEKEKSITEQNENQEQDETIQDISFQKSPAKSFSIKKAIDYSEREEARQVAIAQLDLAFDILAVMSKLNISADSHVYKILIEACGRCGDTARAKVLMGKLNQEGMIPDSSIQNYFINAFSIQNFTGMNNYLPQATAHVLSELSKPYYNKISNDDASIRSRDSFRSESSRTYTTSTMLMNDFIHSFVETGTSMLRVNEKKDDHRKRKTYVTNSIANQLILGEGVLEKIYPNLTINTKIDSCRDCSCRLSESDIVNGWTPCDAHDYTTACPQCGKRFVPHFSVSCSSKNFIGSQGKATPLYCEFLSPWVLRKEMNSIMMEDGNLERILKPAWRSNADINATLWWNLILSFSRYKLPITFLLQGSVKNRLITPSPSYMNTKY